MEQQNHLHLIFCHRFTFPTTSPKVAIFSLTRSLFRAFCHFCDKRHGGGGGVISTT